MTGAASAAAAIRSADSEGFLAIFTHVEIKRHETDEAPFHRRAKFAELSRDLRLPHLVDSVLRLLKCHDYNAKKKSSCFLCLPNWKPQRLEDLVFDFQKATVGSVLGSLAHCATLYICVVNEDLPPHGLEAVQSFVKFYIKLCRVDSQSLPAFITQHKFPLSEANLLALISEKPLKKFHLTLADLVRCNDWCLRIMQTHHAVTNYFMGPGQFFAPHAPPTGQPAMSYMPAAEERSATELPPLGEWHRRPPGQPGPLLTSAPPLLKTDHNPSDFLSSVLSHRLLASQVSNSAASPVNLAANGPASAGPHLPMAARSLSDDLSPSTTSEAFRKKPQRIRTSFDADFELPYLMRRFKETPNPSKEAMEEIKRVLNAMPSRENKRKLDLTNIMYWFKNMRAGFRKRERLSGAHLTDAPAAQKMDLAGMGRDDGDGAVDNEEEEEDGEEEEEEEEEEEMMEEAMEEGGDVRVKVENDDNKENDDKRTAEDRVSCSGLDEETAGDSETEIIEGRPEDFKEEEEEEEEAEREAAPLAISTPKFDAAGPMPEDLSTGRGPPVGLLAWQQAAVSGVLPFHAPPPALRHPACPPLPPGLLPALKTDPLSDEADSELLESASGVSGACEKRKRTRVFIDPTTEVPRLKEWFATDTHPTAQMIEAFTARLNDGEYRKRQQPLEPKNVQLWFKNHRAKVKRRRLNHGEDASPSAFLPPGPLGLGPGSNGVKEEAGMDDVV